MEKWMLNWLENIKDENFGFDDGSEDYLNYEGERCGICMDVVIERGVLDCCQHWFCFACIDNWATITSLCPLCQNEFQLITCVPEKVRQQGVHECLHHDIMVGFGDWEFGPTDISDPFPNKDGSVHLWQGYEDKYIPYKLNRYISQQLPWIQYHEVPDAGHLLLYNATLCEAVFRALLSK